MNHMSVALLILASASHAQDVTRTPVGQCESCEAVFEYHAKSLSAIDTLPGFSSTEPKLKLTGIVYQPDGKTPAEGVVLYIYHTDRKGIYSVLGKASGSEQHHGSYRGWVRTGKDGRYTFYTFRPAGYPNGRAPEHVHAILAEPSGKYYWVNDFFFDDDRNLTDRERRPREVRGSPGVLTLKRENGMLVGERDIVLGRGVEGYR